VITSTCVFVIGHVRGSRSWLAAPSWWSRPCAMPSLLDERPHATQARQSPTKDVQSCNSRAGCISVDRPPGSED
jgi:hypothetical protein